MGFDVTVRERTIGTDDDVAHAFRDWNEAVEYVDGRLVELGRDGWKLLSSEYDEKTLTRELILAGEKMIATLRLTISMDVRR